MVRKIIIFISALLVLFSGLLIAYYEYDSYKNNKEYTQINKNDLSNQNSDYMGWLYIDDVVDLPVVQTDNNRYYLTHSFSREENKYGCLFIDADVKSESNNLIIHGHNNNNTTMFSLLLKYKNENFFNTHKEISYTSKDGDTYIYEIFAVLNYSVTDLNTFNIYSPDLSEKLLEKIKENNIYSSTYEPTVDDKFITLSTCDTEYFGVNGRIVIVGILR